MDMLRQAPWITRLVLVWFVLFIGVAVASPLVKPASGQMVCSAMGGMKMVQDADDGAPSSPQGLDCPLCMPVAAPGPAALPVAHPGALAFALHPLAPERLSSLIGLPWQARAPPALSV